MKTLNKTSLRDCTCVTSGTRRNLIALATALTLGGTLAGSTEAQTVYSMIPIIAPAPSNNTATTASNAQYPIQPTALSNNGQVTGTVYGSQTSAFRWDRHTGLEWLNSFAGLTGSVGGSIDGNGNIAAQGPGLTAFTARQTNSGESIALYTVPGIGSFLPTGNLGSFMVGNQGTGSWTPSGLVWDGQNETYLPALSGGVSTVANGLNLYGTVVGGAENSTTMHPVLWKIDPRNLTGRSYIATDLGTLGGGWGEAQAINKVGQVVGGSSILSQDEHAFYWNGSIIDLGTLQGDTESEAQSLNNLGQIVGFSHGTTPAAETAIYGPDRTRAVLWNSAHAIVDLNDLIPMNSGSYLYDSIGINDSGEILVSALDSNCYMGYFLLTPHTNHPPIIQSTTATELNLSTASQAASVLLKATAYDPDGDTITYTWYAIPKLSTGIGGALPILLGTGPSLLTGLSPLIGSYELVVTDCYGAQTQTTVKAP